MLWIIYFEFFIIYHNVAIETGRKGIISLWRVFLFGEVNMYIWYMTLRSQQHLRHVSQSKWKKNTEKPYSVKVFPFVFFLSVLSLSPFLHNTQICNILYWMFLVGYLFGFWVYVSGCVCRDKGCLCEIIKNYTNYFNIL